jgi:formylglycine-generating enzyme required for sulfatase activity
MLKKGLCLVLMFLAGCTGAPPEPTATQFIVPTASPSLTATPTEAVVEQQPASTDTPTPIVVTQTATAQQVGTDGTALAQTAAPTVSAAAGQGLPTRNADWSPVERNFGGIPMVRVPAGCFAMGADDGPSDERPAHAICFFAPFWIDKFEVRQAQFSALDGVAASPSAFQGNNRPVEQITWFEARDYCIRRGGRLPTEAEWEYAARGPDALDYPWGGEFDPGRAVFSENSGQQTADVGTNPDGASWVGAHDMSGNVSEWTSSLFADYPYDSGDGREADDETTTNQQRVVRGGAWHADDPDNLRTASRSAALPMNADSSIGFRCVRDS